MFYSVSTGGFFPERKAPRVWSYPLPFMVYTGTNLPSCLANTEIFCTESCSGGLFSLETETCIGGSVAFCITSVTRKVTVWCRQYWITCRQGSLSRFLSRIETALRVQDGEWWTFSCDFCTPMYRTDEISRFMASEEINGVKEWQEARISSFWIKSCELLNMNQGWQSLHWNNASKNIQHFALSWIN